MQCEAHRDTGTPVCAGQQWGEARNLLLTSGPSFTRSQLPQALLPHCGVQAGGLGLGPEPASFPQLWGQQRESLSHAAGVWEAVSLVGRARGFPAYCLRAQQSAGPPQWAALSAQASSPKPPSAPGGLWQQQHLPEQTCHAPSQSQHLMGRLCRPALQTWMASPARGQRGSGTAAARGREGSRGHCTVTPSDRQAWPVSSCCSWREEQPS